MIIVMECLRNIREGEKKRHKKCAGKRYGANWSFLSAIDYFLLPIAASLRACVTDTSKWKKIGANYHPLSVVTAESI